MAFSRLFFSGLALLLILSASYAACIQENGPCASAPSNCCEGLVCIDDAGTDKCKSVCPPAPRASYLEYVITQGSESVPSKADIFVFDMGDDYVKTSLDNALVYVIDQSDPNNMQLCYMVVNPDPATPYATYEYPGEFDNCIDYRFIFCPLKASIDDTEIGKLARRECLGSTGLPESNLINPPQKCPGVGLEPADHSQYMPSHSELYQCRKKPGDFSELCWPLMLIFGLLIGASFASGKNPFGMFDFYSPRMGRGKQYMPRMQNKSFDITSYLMAASTAVAGAGKSKDKAKESKVKKEAKRDTNAINDKKAQLMRDNSGMSEQKATRLATREVVGAAINKADLKPSAASGGLFGLLGNKLGKALKQRSASRVEKGKVKDSSGNIFRPGGQVEIAGKTDGKGGAVYMSVSEYLSGKKNAADEKKGALGGLKKGTKEYREAKRDFRQAKRDYRQAERKAMRTDSSTVLKGKASDANQPTLQQGSSQGETITLNSGSTSTQESGSSSQQNQVESPQEGGKTENTGRYIGVTQQNALLNSLISGSGMFAFLNIFSGKVGSKEKITFNKGMKNALLNQTGTNETVFVREGGRSVQAYVKVETQGSNGETITKYVSAKPTDIGPDAKLYTKQSDGSYSLAKEGSKTKTKFYDSDSGRSRFGASMGYRLAYASEIIGQAWSQQGLDKKFRMDFNSGIGQAINSALKILAIMAEMSQYAQGVGSLFSRATLLGQLSKGIGPVEAMNHVRIANLSQYPLTTGNLASWFSPSYAGGTGMPYLSSWLSQPISNLTASVQMKLAGKAPDEGYTPGQRIGGMSFFKTGSGDLAVFDDSGKQLTKEEVLAQLNSLSGSNTLITEFASLLSRPDDKGNAFYGKTFGAVFSSLGAENVFMKKDRSGSASIFSSSDKKQMREMKNELQRQEYYLSSLEKYKQMQLSIAYDSPNRIAQAAQSAFSYEQYIGNQGTDAEILIGIIKRGETLSEKQASDVKTLIGDTDIANQPKAAIRALERIVDDRIFIYSYTASLSESLAVSKQLDSLRNILSEVERPDRGFSSEYIMNEQARMQFYIMNAELARRAKYAMEEYSYNSPSSLILEALRTGDKSPIERGLEEAEAALSRQKSGTFAYEEAFANREKYAIAMEMVGRLEGQIPEGGIQAAIGQANFSIIDEAYTAMRFNAMSGAFWALNAANSASTLLSINSSASYGTSLSFELANQVASRLEQNTLSMPGAASDFRALSSVISGVNKGWSNLLQSSPDEAQNEKLDKSYEGGSAAYASDCRQSISELIKSAINVAKTDLSDEKAYALASNQFQIAGLDIIFLNSQVRSYFGQLCNEAHEKELRERIRYLKDVKAEYEGKPTGEEKLLVRDGDYVVFQDKYAPGVDPGNAPTYRMKAEEFIQRLANEVNYVATQESMLHLASKEYFKEAMQNGSEMWFGRPYFMAKPQYEYLTNVAMTYGGSQFQSQVSGTGKPEGSDLALQAMRPSWQRDFLGAFADFFFDNSKIIYKKRNRSLREVDWGEPSTERQPVADVGRMEPKPYKPMQTPSQIQSRMPQQSSHPYNMSGPADYIREWDERSEGGRFRYADRATSVEQSIEDTNRAARFMLDRGWVTKEELDSGNLTFNQEMVLYHLAQSMYRYDYVRNKRGDPYAKYENVDELAKGIYDPETGSSQISKLIADKKANQEWYADAYSELYRHIKEKRGSP